MKIEWPFMPPKVSSFYKKEPEITEPPFKNKEVSWPKKKITKKTPSVRLIKTQNAKTETCNSNKPKMSDNSSWCDLSDSSNHQSVLDEDDRKKYALKHNRSNSIKEHLSGFDINQFFALEKSEGDIVKTPDLNSVEKEVEALKMRMMDLVEVKNALRDTHCLTEDRKKTMEYLQAKLGQAEQQNDDFKDIIDKQTKKIAELETAKEKQITEFKERFANVRQKEMHVLKLRHLEEMKALEATFQEEMLVIQDELKQQIQEMTKDYERKIEELKKTHDFAIREKDNEILRFENLLFYFIIFSFP